MAIVKQYHKDTDTTYVYESTSYWDAEKGQSRSKRRVIGKIDPVTGEIVPTGKRGRSKKTPSSQDSLPVPSADEAAQEKLLGLELTVASLNKRIAELETENRQLRAALEKVLSLTKRTEEICGVHLSGNA